MTWPGGSTCGCCSTPAGPSPRIAEARIDVRILGFVYKSQEAFTCLSNGAESNDF